MKAKSAGIGRPILTLLVICAAAAGLQAQTGAVLKEISSQKDGNRLIVQLKIEGTYSYEVMYLQSPPRFIVDITPVYQNQLSPYTQIADIGVINFRSGQYKPDTARIVFDLSWNMPSNSISQNPEGLTVTFWYEGEVPPIQTQETVRFREPIPVPETPKKPARDNIFISARAGLAFFLNPELAVENTFDLYGESGTLSELYSFGSVPAFELQIGKYFGIMKAGLGVNLWSLKQPGAFTAVLPHPFLTNAPRTVDFEAPELKNPVWNFYAFALFALVETEKINFSAGPMLGFAKGQFQSLADFNLSERSPYTQADVSMSNLTYTADQYTEFLFGGLLSLEYRLSERVSLVFDTRLTYLNPKITSLSQRANYLQIQPILGIQINF